jgi:hypothetical protein
MSVKTAHKDYAAMQGKWKKCRDVSVGECAIHEGGAKYLPKLSNELDEDYEARKGRTPFFNATYRTIAGLRGMLFRKPPIIEVSKQIEPLTENIDLSGSSLTELAMTVAEEVLTVGRIGLLTDYPKAANLEGATKAQVEAAGVRPSIQMYKAEAILNWMETTINNNRVLSLIVLIETSEAGQKNEFEKEYETRYRVLSLDNGIYRQRLFRIDKHGKDEIVKINGVPVDFVPVMNGQPLSYIPFVFISDDSNLPAIDTPPLIDLVNMNLHHYTVSADYEHGCHFSGLPTLFVFGHNPSQEKDEKIYIGGSSANILPREGSSAQYVEVASQFNALRTNLDSKKAEMAILGARMLESQRASVETAEAVAQHRKGEESLLSQVALSVSKGISRSLGWMSEWAGDKSEVKCEINRDFVPATLTSVDITALVSAWQAGAISQNVLFENLKSGEIIQDDVTFEEEQSRINESAPKMSAASPMKPKPAKG